jgi:serine/threonine protein kinase
MKTKADFNHAYGGENYMQELIGKQFGPYQIQHHLAKGGMANVFLAHHVESETEQLVAIKLVHTSTGENCERFRRETQALSTLHHAHILPALAYGEQDSWCYLITPYIENGTLTHQLRQGPLSLEEATEIFVQMVSALHYAHKQGIVHRDIKSSNVLMRDMHHAYLADFGLVKHIGRDSSLTISSLIIGTPEYMAPELAQEEASTRSDIYALGILLYQMLTGRVPFKGDAPIQVYLKHIQEQPVKPSALNPAIPPEIEQVVLRALAKNPAKRYQTAQDFHTAYQQALVRANARQLKNTDAATHLSTTMLRLAQIKRATQHSPDKAQQQKASLARQRQRVPSLAAPIATGILLALSLLSTSGIDAQHLLQMALAQQPSTQIAHDKGDSTPHLPPTPPQKGTSPIGNDNINSSQSSNNQPANTSGSNQTINQSSQQGNNSNQPTNANPSGSNQANDQGGQQGKNGNPGNHGKQKGNKGNQHGKHGKGRLTVL